MGPTKLAKLWSGVVEIDVHCDRNTAALLETVQTTSSIVIEIVREAVSNAIRHGDASHISIDISVNEAASDVVVTVINNGALVPEHPVSGIGSQQLDDMTLTWSRENRADGVSLTATVPL
jgi:signal transduction histidine kinase